MVRTILFHSGECRVVLDWLWALYPQLVLDDIKDFVDEEPQLGVVLHLEDLKWIQREDREHLSFAGVLTLIWVIGIGWSLVL